MKQSTRAILFCVILFLSYFPVLGAPAFPGKIVLMQPDGTEFHAMLRGDESFHVLITAEGHAIIQDTEGYYCYAVYGPDGTKESTGYRVGGDVPASVLSASRSIPYDMLAAKAVSLRRHPDTVHEEPILYRISKAKGMTKAGEGGPAVKHGIVILAAFKDLPFTFGKADFESLLSQPGYNVNGATGSAKDYFDAQFNGLFEFEFDVFGPVTLSRKMEYYGANSSKGNDVRAHEMIKEACKLADEQGADFTKYDDDNDGTVDNVYVFYAGGDAAQGAGDKHIWAHAWYLGEKGARIPESQRTFDAVKADRYACSAELSLLSGVKTPVITGIGTFCHEYSHTLGLMDMYDTDDTKHDDSNRGLWQTTSLMDAGNYNNFGKTPPYYNAIEREMTGIFAPEDLKSGTYTMAPISENGTVYRIAGDNEGEYYLLECRNDSNAEKPWDSHIGGRGMLIYHVDKSETDTGFSKTYDRNMTAGDRWVYNEVNANRDHECAYLASAGKGIFFPFNNAVSFEPEFWNGKKSWLAVENIVHNGDGSITFSAATAIRAGNIKAEAFQDFAIISWKAPEGYENPSYICIPAVSDTVFTIRQKDGRYVFTTSEHSTGEENGQKITLKPGTEYTAQIHFKDKHGNDTAKENITFNTARYREGSYPYIFLKNVERNSDGTFKAGAGLPLALYNAIGEEVVWYMDDEEIKRGDNGYYTVAGNGGILKAVINIDGQHTHTITKEIIVR